MTLKDLLKKKDKIHPDDRAHDAVGQLGPPVQAPPEFTFMRSTTTTQEIIDPPSFDDDSKRGRMGSIASSSRRLSHRMRRPSNVPKSPVATSPKSETHDELQSPKQDRRLSERLHLHSRSRSGSTVSSANVPTDLPEIGGNVAVRNEEDQGEWEKRATLLISKSPLNRPSSASSHHDDDSTVVNKAGDVSLP
jgi:hypothetical protein